MLDYENRDDLNHKLFGENFNWGVSASAYQTEGAYNTDGKGLSIWDVFSQRKGKIKNHEHAQTACDFYHRFEEDISIIKSLNIPNFRFSVAWSRILPAGTGNINQKGIDFYKRVIDTCLEKNIEPWLTLYHWDLPEELEKKGGWVNREIVNWFSEYVNVCVQAFKDKVKYWMVLNEPMVITGAGYFLGIHAPGKKGLKHFLPAVHHAVLCQSAGAKIIKQQQPVAEVGSTFSCSYITPHTDSDKDRIAVKRMDALLNRLFIEPALGLGYPKDALPLLRKIEKYMLDGDAEKMKADFDFIGIQNYTREVAAHSFLIPYLNSKLIPADKRKVYHTSMNWEVYPEAIYEMIKKFSAYGGIKKLIITENGAAFPDKVENNEVHDEERINYLSHYLEQVLKAKQEGYKTDGYFVWSLTDNFEWAEGYRPKFGLVHVDFETQKRIIKDSGYWYKKFLS
jgi:beta-glucosidase